MAIFKYKTTYYYENESGACRLLELLSGSGFVPQLGQLRSVLPVRFKGKLFEEALVSGGCQQSQITAWFTMFWFFK